jgi:hypothetical protein
VRRGGGGSFRPIVVGGCRRPAPALVRALSEPPAVFLRWASWAALSWWPSPGTRQVKVLQILGDADRTLQIRYTRPDGVVRDGGHLLPLTHPEAVNEFLREAGA